MKTWKPIFESTGIETYTPAGRKFHDELHAAVSPVIKRALRRGLSARQMFVVLFDVSTTIRVGLLNRMFNGKR
jgi:hypothetical protein